MERFRREGKNFSEVVAPQEEEEKEEEEEEKKKKKKVNMKMVLITLLCELALPAISCIYETTCGLVVKFSEIFTVIFQENSFKQTYGQTGRKA
jgi:CO dehydrogenase/acetyl-CoA synthase beta subunit